MSPTRRRRLLWLLALSVALAGFTYALIRVFSDNMVFFYTPSQLRTGAVAAEMKFFRLGGMVVPGSVQREPTSLRVRFELGDSAHSVPVYFSGILPDLFKERSGAVVEGHWNGQIFQAREVLAKHDENYMPPGIKP